MPSCLRAGGEPQDRTTDRKIARIASRQHGVATWAEMRHADVAAIEIKRRAASGALIRVFPGVYRVGHAAPSIEASFIAAVKACGEGSALRERAAAFLWSLIKKRPPEPEVLTLTERRVEGVDTKRARAVLARRPNSRGAKRLRAAMYGDQALKLSKLEAASIELLRAASLSLPKTNKRRDGHLIDCRWPDRKLTIELDSYTYHATKYAWKQDRRRG